MHRSVPRAASKSGQRLQLIALATRRIGSALAFWERHSEECEHRELPRMTLGRPWVSPGCGCFQRCAPHPRITIGALLKGPWIPVITQITSQPISRRRWHPQEFLRSRVPSRFCTSTRSLLVIKWIHVAAISAWAAATERAELPPAPSRRMRARVPRRGASSR